MWGPRQRTRRRMATMGAAVTATFAAAALTATGAQATPLPLTTHYFSQVSTFVTSPTNMFTYVSAWDPLSPATAPPSGCSTLTASTCHYRIAVQRDAPVSSQDSNGNPITGNISQGYWMNPDTGALGCVTCNVPDSDPTRQRGIQDVFPGGNYVVETAEESTDGWNVTQNHSAIPGQGVNNDIYFTKSDGTSGALAFNSKVQDPQNACHQTWDSANGALWPRLNHAGTQLVWAELNSIWGNFRLCQANVNYTAGAPTSLSNYRSFTPPGQTFFEPFGFSPDDSQILFIGGSGALTTQLYRVNTDWTGLTQLTPNGVSTDHAEFATYTPDGGHIMFGTNVASSSTGKGIDFWMMNPDGSNRVPLTNINEPWSSQYQGYRNVGGWAFNPQNSSKLVLGACTGSFWAGVNSCDTANVLRATLSTIGTASGNGLTAAYYSSSTFASGNLLYTATDPLVNHWWDNTMDHGFHANDLSVQWSGYVTPYAAGPYTFCAYVNNGVQITVGGTVVVNALTNTAGSKICGSAVNLTAGKKTILVKYANPGHGGNQDSVAKLLWTTPSSPQGPEVIPTQQLSTS
jgi:hypothetical protein